MRVKGRARLAAGWCLGLTALFSCSKSNAGPTDPVVGTWHVSIGSARGVTADSACEFAEFFGLFNATRDSIRGSMNIINRGSVDAGCSDYTGITAVKQ